ncbi:MAG: phage tail tape measure protein [Fusobacterium sp.]
MQEDIKLNIKVDTSQAKKNVNKLSKNIFKELEQEANGLGKKVSDIKLKKENFSKEQIVELRKEIENTALKAKTIYFKEGNKSAKELIDRLKEMHKVLGQNKSEIKNTEKLFTKMDAIVLTTFQYIATKGIEAMKQLVSEGMKFSRELEYADKKIQSISDKSSIEIQSNIGELSLETGTDPIELRNGLYEIISAVGDVDEAYNLLRTSNKLAITGFTDIGNAVDGLTTVLNAYQMQLSEADRIANVFVKTQKLGKITVDEFARDLAQSVPYATQLGIKIEEIGSAIALLTSRGVKPAQAETQLASFLRNILDDNNELAKELNKSFGMGIKEYIQNGGDLIKILEEISNIENRLGKSITSFSMDSEAKAFILTLKDGKEAYKNFYKEISDGNDAINRNMNNMMNSQKAALDRAKTYWKELSRTVGTSAGQIIAYITDIITGYDKIGADKNNLESLLSNRLEETVNILSKLESGTTLTEEEQKKLNEHMNYFSAFAPNVSNAYKTITDEAVKYKETLQEINKIQVLKKQQQKVKDEQQLKNDIINAKNSVEKVKKELDKTFKERVDWGAGTFYKSISFEEAKSKGMVENASLEQKKKVQKLLDKLETENKKLENAEKALEKLQNKDNTEVKTNTPQEDTTPKPVSKTDDELKLEKEKEYKKRELEIETAYNNARLKATKTYNEQMSALKGKGTEEEIKAIREAYQKALTRAEYNKDIADINNKMKNTYYSTENEKELNNKYLQSQKDFLKENNLMEIRNEEQKKIDEEKIETEKNLKKSLDNVSSNLRNLSSLFQTIGDNTGSTSIKNLANIGNLGSTIFDTIKNSSQGEALLESVFGKGAEKMLGLENFTMGAGIGGALSGILGGGAEGNIGSTLGSAVGTIVGGPVGSVVGGALGSAVGSVFGRSSKKKKKREERKRRAAQERLKQGMISGQFKWADVLEEYNEDL